MAVITGGRHVNQVSGKAGAGPPGILEEVSNSQAPQGVIRTSLCHLIRVIPQRECLVTVFGQSPSLS